MSLSLTLGGACSEDVEKPPPPDMDDIIDAFANPSAELTGETLPVAFDSLEGVFRGLDALCGFEPIRAAQPCGKHGCRTCQGLDPLSEAFNSVANSADEDARELSERISGINGYFNLTRACAGSDERPNIHPRNGMLRVSIGFTSAGVDPTFGGSLIDCQTRVKGRPTVVDGDLDFAFGSSFFLDQIVNREPIIRFRGRVENSEVFEVSTAVRLSFREGGDIAVLVPMPDGTNLVYYNGRSGQGLEASNGRFACTLDGPDDMPLSCQNVATGEQLP